MSLIKNPEANTSDRDSSHLRIGRITFGTKAPVIAEVATRLAIHQNLRDGLTDDIHAVAVELKRRPRERIAFEVVSEVPDRETAALFSLGIPMRALREAGVDLEQLVHLHPPTLVSNNRREDPLDHEMDLGLYHDLLGSVDDLAIPPTPAIQVRPALVPVTTELVIPAFAHAA